MKNCVVSINVPPPQLWGGQHTEMFVDHVTVFSQSVSHIRLSHTIYVAVTWSVSCSFSRILDCVAFTGLINVKV